MSEDFNARYRLLKCVAVDEGIRSHNAQELATGRVVMVHLADAAGPDDVDRLRAMLTRLPGADKNRVLETATLPSGFAIVTEFLAGLTSFPSWLAARVTPSELPSVAEPRVAPPVEVAPAPVTPAVELAPPVAATPEAPAAPGAFTQMFGAPRVPSAASPWPDTVGDLPQMLAQETPLLQQYPSLNTTLGGIPVQKAPIELVTPPAPMPPAPPATAPAPPKTGPGDFTLMFSAPATAAPLPNALPPSPVAPAAWSPLGSAPPPNVQPPAMKLGIVTPPSFMAAPAPWTPAPSAPAPFAPTPPSPGNASPVFGSSPLFGSSAPASSAPVAPLPITPSATPLSSGLGASPLSASPLSASPAGGAYGLPPGVLSPPMFGQAGTTPLSPMGGIAPKPTAGPSDFTRLISQAAPPVVPPAPTPAAAKPAATAAPAKRAIPMGLIVVINAVILLAVIVIVFVLRKPQPRVPSTPAVPRVPSVSAPALK